MNSLSKLLLTLLLLGAFTAQALETAQVRIVTQTGAEIPFSVEVARTREEQAQGLMFRQAIPEGTGMLFSFDPPRKTSFWMKNTFVSLDIIFIGTDGKILKVEQGEPGSLDAIPSGGEVAYVLEIAAGEAERRGIKAGDRLER